MDNETLLLTMTIQEAIDGDTDAARELVTQLCEHFRNATVPPMPLRLYFYKAFTKFLSPEPPDQVADKTPDKIAKALHLIGKQGAPTKAVRDWKIAREVEVLREQGLTRDNAIAQAAEKYCLSDSATLKIYSAARADLKAQKSFDNLDQEFAPDK